MGPDPVAFTSCLNTVFLEPPVWAWALLDIHKVLRKRWNPHTWKQPVSFLRAGKGEVGWWWLLRHLLNTEREFGVKHTREPESGFFVFFVFSFLIYLFGFWGWVFLLLQGNLPWALLSMASLFSCYTTYRATFRLCSLDSSLDFHWEKNLTQFHSTLGGRRAMRVWVGWAGASPAVQASEAGNDTLHHCILVYTRFHPGGQAPSSSLPRLDGLVTPLHASRGFSLSSRQDDEWCFGSTLKDWGDKYTSFVGKQAPGHTLSKKNEMASELFVRYVSAFVFIVGLYLVFMCIYICMYIFKYAYVYSIYTHFIKNKH